VGYGAQNQGRVLSSAIACQVVPDIATFAVDDGFSYTVSDEIDVVVGSRVRIKVSGRRLKGFVTAVFEADPTRRLLPIEGLSGEVPSFDEESLATLRWAATHYVTPLSVLLKRTLPPNIPKRLPSSGPNPTSLPSSGMIHEDALYLVGHPPYGAAIAEAMRDSASADRNVVIVAPTAVEVDEIAGHLAAVYGDRVVQATSSMPGAAVTASWTRITAGGGAILVGTREIMLWPFGNVGLVVVVEDGRRVMRSQGTPTLGVREVVLRRSGVEGFRVAFFGPVPTLEVLASGAAIVASDARQWPLVEVVDRGEEPPGSALLTERAKASIKRAVASKAAAFVLVGSRGYAPAFRCVRCGEVRRCGNCSSAASRDDACRRCGFDVGRCSGCAGGTFQALGAGIGRIVDEVAGVIGSDLVGRSEEGRLVTVGTERDLIGVHDGGLALAVDIDGLTMAPHYRAAEDGLRLLVRLAQTVGRGRGGRCIIQTAEPDQPVVTALVQGRSEEFLAGELAARARFGFPPQGSLIAIETDGGSDAGALLEEHVAPLATVMGPARVGERMRWLVQGQDLDPARLALRRVVGTLRGKGAKVRVDVDPLDL
jgi:primosomal protein N' (replication factor Y)